MSEQSGKETPDLRSELDHRERQIDAIRRVSDALFSYSSVDAMLRETLAVAIDVVGADVGSLEMYDAENDTLVFRYLSERSSPSLLGYTMAVSEGIAGRVFRTGISDLSNEVKSQPEFNSEVDARTGYCTESMMTVPLKRSEGNAVGVMQVLNARRRFDLRDLEVLEVLAAQAAAAIEQSHRVEQARRAEIVNVLADVAHDITNMMAPIKTGILTLRPCLDDVFGALDTLCKQGPGDMSWPEAISKATAVVRNDYVWMLGNALDAADEVEARTREMADAVKGEVSLPHFESADVNKILKDVARTLSLVAKKKRVRVETQLDPDLPPAELDRRQVYNAIYNLVNNAIPETPPGGSVILRSRRPKSGERTLSIEVEDTGKGMPEHVRERWGTSEAVSTKAGGTGLGSRIVMGVVRRHQGAVDIRTEAGRGTTFTIRLPLRQHHTSAEV